MSFIGNVPAESYTTVVKDTFSGNDSTTDFTLSIPATTNGVEVFVENVQQEPTDAYTISGTTLSFTAAPVTGTDNIYVIHRGPAVQQVVPPAGVAIDASSVTASGNLSVTGTSTLTGNVTASGDVSIADKIIHTGDTNTAIRFPAADTVTFETSGSERVRVDSSGNVGIGTTSPNLISGTKALTVNGTGDASIEAAVNGTLHGALYGSGNGAVLTGVGANGIRFNTASSGSATERMRIDSSGNLLVGTTSAAGNVASVTSANQVTLRGQATNASQTNPLIYLSTTRSNSNAFRYLLCDSGNGADNEFRLEGDGNAFADGTWSGGGADYAEYFEWLDGNTSNEDRRGYTVVLDGNKVRKATDADDSSQIIGAVSATPCVVGDHADNKWTGKYLKDDFGNYIFESHNVVEWTEQELVEEAQEAVFDEEGNVIEEAKEAVYKEKNHSYEDWNIPEGITVPDDATVLTQDENGNPFTHRKLNPDFDPDVEYIPRSKRPEWSPIGMMGKLRIRKGQPVGDRWIKMRDISDSVEEWLVR